MRAHTTHLYPVQVRPQHQVWLHSTSGDGKVERLDGCASDTTPFFAMRSEFTSFYTSTTGTRMRRSCTGFKMREQLCGDDDCPIPMGCVCGAGGGGGRGEGGGTLNPNHTKTGMRRPFCLVYHCTS